MRETALPMNVFSKNIKVCTLGFRVLVGIVIIFQAFFSLSFPQTVRAVTDPNNDVIRGGVNNLSELRSAYNSRADVQALFKSFGVTEDKLTDAHVSNVTFNFADQGALGTRSVGRINYPSTIDNNLGQFAGTSFYSRNAAEWEGSSPAYFFGKLQSSNGKYYYVWIIKDCGNIAYRPAEAPKARSTSQPTPSQDTPGEVSCAALRANITSGTRKLTVHFTGDYTANKAGLVNSFTFDFGDGIVKTQATPDIFHEYDNPGSTAKSYRAVMTVNSTLGSRTSSACQLTIQVLPAVCPAEKPGTYPNCQTPVIPAVAQPPAATPPPAPPQALPSTGPPEVAIATVGVSLLGFSGYQYYLSRRRLYQF